MAALLHLVSPVLLLLVGANVLHATLTCNPGASLFGNRCYQVYRPGPKCPEDFNQTSAEAFCRSNDGVLASIHSQAHNDFIADLIKKSQQAQAKKNKCNSCPTPKRDYFYWIGLELEHRGNGTVSGSSWTDNSPVNYGDPMSNSFRPPFVTGHPEGSAGDGSDPAEVCPPGNEKGCVQMYGFGKTVGKWKDQHCSNSHRQNVSCSCPPQANSTVSVRRHHKHSSSSSSSSSDDEEDHIDECRDEAALNGLVCQYCPAGWTPFQGRCYRVVAGAGSHAAQQAKCQALDPDSNIASINSDAENVFVTNLAIQGGLTGSAAAGIHLTYNTNTFQAPPIAAGNVDGTQAVYGNPLIAPWNTPGTYPWAPAIPPGILYPNQPDNRPPPANCVVYWLPGGGCAGCAAGTWDDLDCADSAPSGAVCKL